MNLMHLTCELNYLKDLQDFVPFLEAFHVLKREREQDSLSHRNKKKKNKRKKEDPSRTTLHSSRYQVYFQL